MAQNPHLASWAREIWEMAIESKSGLSLSYESKRAAEAARFALYTARNSNRRENAEIFPEGDPQHGKSPWDVFRVQVDPGDAPFYDLVITRHEAPSHAPREIKEL